MSLLAMVLSVHLSNCPLMTTDRHGRRPLLWPDRKSDHEKLGAATPWAFEVAPPMVRRALRPTPPPRVAVS
jgi:hypothetical protein